MTKDFYAIGHITNDLEPFPHVGGGVTYSSVVAARLGFTAHIITKCAIDSLYIKELEDMGIVVHVLPLKDKAKTQITTSFKNVYDSQGKRTQYCPEQQEYITAEDLPNFPDIPKDSTILIAPVIGEIAPELFERLSKKGNLSVIPQGYFREISPDGRVSQKPISDPSFFQYAKYTILSEEDLGFDPPAGGVSFTNSLKSICPTLILTQGESGSTIYQQDQEIHIPAFGLESSEIVDFTGAGDCYAASYLLQKAEDKSDKEAGYFASFFAAQKIAGLGGKEVGLPTIPTSQDIKNYVQSHNKRIHGFV